jgi:hypothetical protein
LLPLKFDLTTFEAGLTGAQDLELAVEGDVVQLLCDRTTSKMRGFVSQDHIGGFSTKRECANTHK